MGVGQIPPELIVPTGKPDIRQVLVRNVKIVEIGSPHQNR